MRDAPQVLVDKAFFSIPIYPALDNLNVKPRI
jgi:hypothetical protein